MKFKLLLLTLLLVFITTPILAATQTVTNCADSGAGSLRQAIADANDNDEIVFDISLEAVGYSTGALDPGLVTNEAGGNTWFRIIVSTTQLSLSNKTGINIKGSTQTREANNSLGPKVEIRQGNTNINGFYLYYTHYCTIEGLVVNGFNGGYSAIRMSDSTYNDILGCYLGTTTSGEAAYATNRGVRLVSNSNHNRIGDGTVAGRNIISGNTFYGININESNSNEVTGNYIGTEANGTSSLANSSGGILIENSSTDNRIGSSESSGQRNIISGHSGSGDFGIKLDGVTNNYIEGNWIGIGTDESEVDNNYGIEITNSSQNNQIISNIIAGNNPYGIYIHESGTNSNEVLGNYLGNVSNGQVSRQNWTAAVYIYNGSQYNKIGNGTQSGRNIISGNNANGIQIDSSNSNDVLGNYIGTKPDGESGLSNGDAIEIINGSKFNRIGDGTAGGRNIISNNDYAITIKDTGTNSNEVLGNYIGTDKNGTTAVANSSNGVDIQNGAQFNIIGDGTAGGRNIISGNTQHGIRISGSNSNEVTGNYIGTEANGTSSLPNSSGGILIENSATGNRIGSLESSDQRNIISGHNGSSDFGVKLDGVSNNYIEGNWIGY